MILKDLVLIIVSTIFVLSCGSSSSSKKEEQARLDANDVTLTPPPGDYDYGPIVIFKKKDDGAGSGALEIQKADGSWSFAWSECYGGVSTGSTCVSVPETKKIAYRLSTIAGESSEKSAQYNISFKQKDVIINGSTFTESLTDCAVSSSSGVNKLEGRIKLSNNSVLGETKVLYLFFSFSDLSKIGQALTITSGTDDGLAIKGTGDTAPYSAYDFYPGRYSGSNDQCVVNVTEYTAGQKATGTAKCDLSTGTYGTATILGKSATIPEYSWQCDRWVLSLL
ncbi:MAG: hypothetical protein HQK54_02165 [Oligoflexales bacterium]|nr:hypothetical protein [Oligoflexales bacterium]